MPWDVVKYRSGGRFVLLAKHLNRLIAHLSRLFPQHQGRAGMTLRDRNALDLRRDRPGQFTILYSAPDKIRCILDGVTE